MKILYYLAILILPFSASAQGIEFFEGSLEEAMEKAAQEEKLIFVDCYTTWCGPCKMMSNNIFPLESVGELYNKNYVALKLNMEKEKGMKFGSKYPVSAYPTLFYLNAKGEIIQKVVGAKREQEFLAIGTAMIKKNDRTADFSQRFEEGERDFDFVLKYIKELNKVDKPSIGIANTYLKENPAINADQKAQFLMEAATEADSKLFDQLIAMKSEAIKISSEKAFNEKVLAACNKTVDKAIEHEYEDLIIETTEKLKKVIPSEVAVFEYQSMMKYAKTFKSYEEWSKQAKKYFKKAGKNYNTYNNLIADAQGYYRSNEQAKKDLLKWYEALIKCEECGPQEFLNYAQILLDGGDKKRAMEVAQTILKKTKDQGKPTSKIEHYIKYIESHS